jgi:hypothetical protein
MSRTQDALLRLYENADLRDELTDDEAETLLKWAEAELARIDAASPDDAGFEAQAETLTSLLKRMNRFAGRQGQISAQGVDPAPTNIAGLATELGHPASPEQIAATGTGDPASTIAALTALMSASAQAAPPEPEPPVSVQAAPPPAPETDLPIQAQTTESAPQENLQPSHPAAPTLPAEPASEPFGDPFDDIDL